MILLICCLMVVLNGIGQGVLKATAINRELSYPHRLMRLGVAYSFSTSGVILSVFLLTLAPISVLTLVISAHFVVAAIVGRVIFNETLTQRNWLGIGLVVSGAILSIG